MIWGRGIWELRIGCGKCEKWSLLVFCICIWVFFNCWKEFNVDWLWWWMRVMMMSVFSIFFFLKEDFICVDFYFIEFDFLFFNVIVSDFCNVYGNFWWEVRWFRDIVLVKIFFCDVFVVVVFDIVLKKNCLNIFLFFRFWRKFDCWVMIEEWFINKKIRLICGWFNN